jgi:putative ABC transport system permease protein
MLRATVKSLLARKLRLALSAFAIILAVAFVSAALVLQDTLNRSLDQAYGAAYDRIQLQVTQTPPLGGNPAESAPPPIDASAVGQVAQVSGVAGSQGEVRVNGARLIGKDGRVPDTGGQRFGVAWHDGEPGVALRDGTSPKAADEVVINAALAEETGYRVGDRVGVLTTQPRRDFRIVGIATYDGRDELVNGEQTVTFTEPVAQELMLGKPGTFSAIDVRLASGARAETVRGGLEQALGAAFTVRTGEEVAKDASGPARGSFTTITWILLGFAAVAVLVGSFLIANAFSIVVAQRTRELALLRALGAGRGQVRRSVLLEAIIVSVFSWIVGFSLGLLIGRGGASMLAGGENGIPIAGFDLPLSALLVSLAVGVGVTLVAALLPARRASRVPPVAAMRLTAQKERPSKVGTIIGLVLTALGAALLGIGLAQEEIGLVGPGALVILVALIMVTPAIASPVLNGLGRLLTRSVPGRLGRLNSVRHPRRTAMTAVSLMIGVLLVTVISTVLSSLQSTASTVLDNNLKAELSINSGGVGAGGVPPTIDPKALAAMRALPDVAGVGAYAFEDARINGADDFVTSWDDIGGLTKVAAIEPVTGTVTADKVLLNAGTAKRLKLAVGDTLRVQMNRGAEQSIQVGAIFKDTQVADAVILPWAVASTGFRTDQPNQAYVKLRDGASVTDAKAAVSALLRDSPEVEVRTRSELVDQASGQIGLIVAVVQVLLAIAMIIAILGVVNTLVLSVLERTNELGMLRAIGMYRGQLRRMITVESMLISLFGAILGVVVGAGVGLALVRTLKSQGISEMAVPWPLMLGYVVAAALVGVLAALAPAGRAAKLNVLAAIRHS